MAMTMTPMFDEVELLPWPKPELRVIEGGRADAPAPLRVQTQRRPSAKVLRRRRQLVAAVALLMLGLVGWGVSAILPAQRPVGSGIDLAAGISMNGFYTVQPGDTVNSIADQLANGRPVAQVKQAIVEALGSSVVIPGEQVPIP